MQRDKLDSIKEIKKAAGVNAHVFGKDPEAMTEQSLKRFREETERKFHAITHDYVALCRRQGDHAALENLAARLANIREHLFEIDRNLAFIGKPQFNSEKVAMAMGWLLAYHEATVRTLELNERTSVPVEDCTSSDWGHPPQCPSCGHVTVANGACYKCLNCGESVGCS